MIIACGISVFSGCGNASDQVASLGTLERDRIELIAESNEPILRIFVVEGQGVEAGEILLTQDAARAQVALKRAQAEVAVARSTLAEAEKGPRQQQITQARSRLTATESATATLRAELDRELALLDRQLISKATIDITEGKYNEAVARQAEAQAVLDELLEGTRSEEIDQARAHHAAALANLQNLEITLARADIIAPVSGTIESLPFEIGERPPSGATVLIMLAEGPTYARVHISEPLRAVLQPGHEASILLDGHPDPLTGKLRWVSSRAAFTPYFSLNQHDRSRLSYVAEIDVVEPADNLPVGIPVEVTFRGLADD